MKKIDFPVLFVLLAIVTISGCSETAQQAVTQHSMTVHSALNAERAASFFGFINRLCTLSFPTLLLYISAKDFDSGTTSQKIIKFALILGALMTLQGLVVKVFFNLIFIR